MFEIGRLCVKIAGRDAGRKCVVVDILDSRYVLIDGLTRRRKCNVAHLEPLKTVLQVKKGASSKDIADALEKEGIKVAAPAEKKAKETKPTKTKEEKPAKTAEKPTKTKAPKKETKAKTAKN